MPMASTCCSPSAVAYDATKVAWVEPSAWAKP